MADETSYGWAGKILRVNLSTGSITTQPTDPYKEYIGGMGLANKIMYDEVPAGTDPFSPENKLIFAVGPLTASGVPLAGRTTICSLSTFTKDHLVVDAHCGGMIGARIKQAGYDAITRTPGSGARAWQSLQLLLASGVDYECRTTWHEGLFDTPGLLGLAEQLARAGVVHWALQECRTPDGPPTWGLTPAQQTLLQAQFPGFVLRSGL